MGVGGLSFAMGIRVRLPTPNVARAGNCNLVSAVILTRPEVMRPSPDRVNSWEEMTLGKQKVPRSEPILLSGRRRSERIRPGPLGIGAANLIPHLKAEARFDGGTRFMGPECRPGPPGDRGATTTIRTDKSKRGEPERVRPLKIDLLWFRPAASGGIPGAFRHQPTATWRCRVRERRPPGLRWLRQTRNSRRPRWVSPTYQCQCR